MKWHQLLGNMFSELLSPVGVEVHTDYSVMTAPPEADVLLVQKRRQARWTDAQRERLPDGIRQSSAQYHLVEFKKTESLNKEVIQQILGYTFFFRRAKNVKAAHCQPYVLVSRTPLKGTLENLGYLPTELAGVYQSQSHVMEEVLLLVANELANEPHNALVKCFASRSEEQKKAFDQLEKGVQQWGLPKLENFLSGLYKYYAIKRKELMKYEMTPDDVAELGKVFGSRFLASLSPEERLEGLSPEDQEKLRHMLQEKLN